MRTIGFNQEGYRVPEGIFGYLQRVVFENRECERCESIISQDNPHVCLNICLRCFMSSEGKRYQYIGPIENNKIGEESFRFLDENGYIYSTSSWKTPDNCSIGDTRSQLIPETLEYWGFPKSPQTMPYDGREDYGYNIYPIGDMKEGNVLLLHYAHRFSSLAPEYWFLAYKGGHIVPFERRKGIGRRLWKEAKDAIEVTRDEHGLYKYNGSTSLRIHDHWLHNEIVRIANEEAGAE